ncbi:MAG: hypothetical protein Q7T68_00685 [Sphingopyxis sp.]|nr:hypothetical protein [Sphingopyxis sp.]
MTNRTKGQESKAVSLPLLALALSLAGTSAAWAQENGTPTPAPSSTRPLDFRLPPANDGRTPGVQGPADNGLPPVAPGERLGPRPTPIPAPTLPRVNPAPPTASPSTPTPAPIRRDAVQPAPRSAPATDGSTTAASPASGSAPLPLPDRGTSDIAPAPAPDTVPVTDDSPVAATPGDASPAVPLWAWLFAVLAAVGAGFWYWRRRTEIAGPADEAEAAPRAPVPPAAPRAGTSPIKPAASPPSPRRVPPSAQTVRRDVSRLATPLVTRPAGEQRALVGMALEVRSIRFAPDHVAVGFALNLVNQGVLPATGLMVRIALNQGSAMPEPVLSRFFDGAGGSVLRDDMILAVGASELLSTEVVLPRATIEPLMIGGKPMLVPVIAFDVTYHWDGEGEAFGQNAGSFVLGRAAVPGAGDKLAPLPLDRASHVVDRPAARATAIKRSQ